MSGHYTTYYRRGRKNPKTKILGLGAGSVMLLDSTNFQAHGHHRSRRRPRSPYPLAHCPLLALVNQRNCLVWVRDRLNEVKHPQQVSRRLGVLLSTWAVSKMILSPNSSISPTVIQLPVSGMDDMEKTIYANSITLTYPAP